MGEARLLKRNVWNGRRTCQINDVWVYSERKMSFCPEMSDAKVIHETEITALTTRFAAIPRHYVAKLLGILGWIVVGAVGQYFWRG